MSKKLVFTYNEQQIPIELIRSKRKSITLTVNSLGEIIVKAPNYILIIEIKRFISNQTNWINTKLLRAQTHIENYSLDIGTYIPYLGDEVILLEGTHKKGIVKINNSIFLPMNYQNKKELLNKWYREEARIILTELTNKYINLIQTQYNKIYIKEQKTRWGSCSSKCNLNYNWKVILTKPELVEYLVIHEVCHLIHLDHSQKFWNLVSKYDPNFKTHRKKLQEAGHYLLSFLK